jgi:hypothetical protein
MRLRSYQRVHASNIFEAVFNNIVAATAGLWVPLLAIYLGYLWLTAPPDASVPMSRADCVRYARELDEAERALAKATLVGERKLAQEQVEYRRKFVADPRWQRDCAKVSR